MSIQGTESGLPSKMRQDVMQDWVQQIRINLSRQALTKKNFNPWVPKLQKKTFLKFKTFRMISTCFTGYELNPNLFYDWKKSKLFFSGSSNIVPLTMAPQPWTQSGLLFLTRPTNTWASSRKESGIFTGVYQFSYFYVQAENRGLNSWDRSRRFEKVSEAA